MPARSGTTRVIAAASPVAEGRSNRYGVSVISDKDALVSFIAAKLLTGFRERCFSICRSQGLGKTLRSPMKQFVCPNLMFTLFVNTENHAHGMAVVTDI